MIQIEYELYPGKLIKRYKRFLADIELADGEIITAHCPNPGSMLGCSEPGSNVLLRHSKDPKRKLPYTWMIIFVGATPVNVDTQIPNAVLFEAVSQGKVPLLQKYAAVRREVPFADSRFDLCLTKGSGMEPEDRCFVEVKSTTLVEDGVAMFPDAPTVRGRKHLATLTEVARQGIRAVQFYCISRGDARLFRPADHIDPLYGKALREAVSRGVEVMAWDLHIAVSGEQKIIELARPMQIELA